jgi:predicted nucleotide-binding protein
MLDNAGFAFLVMTAEETHADATTHARENVIHETGLFQGRLGFRRAIILLKGGCTQFSNIHGLTHIGFPKGKLELIFESVRRVLEREQVI